MKYYIVWVDEVAYSYPHNAYCESKKAAEDYARNFEDAEIKGPYYMKLTKSNVLELVNHESLPL